ncbi:FAD-dependent monooxygenase [Pigmentiphaga litoralis]|uniref:Salicylate hydroxylase n=1 Tax=Pigmentiphaga litoralis TaxID=516702 RepID=A0A7Y9IUC1_9BURK|nr:FAD-dependent monooxygenase [Pigmentiphaga litoralis]NYE23942.1 salicylate hydroxylase [Pigmentiphaga litoralis]NYE82444.1 salicylate hydroxylase [Pigmentiphaga litoralis]
MNQKPRVIIAGAGIGGLTAAACLLKRGYPVQIFEQASALAEVGAGVQSSANAVKVLIDLGLRDELEKTAVRPEAFEFRRYDTAELMHRIPLGKQHEAANGAPYYHIHRADLHELLAKAVMALDPHCIHLKARAIGFDQGPKGVVLHLHDGRQALGDVLIGADGIKSAIRTQILGPTPASYTGDVAWRAVIPTHRLPADIMDTVSTVWCGPKRHVVMYYLRARTLLNFAGLVEHPFAEVESWTQKRPWEDMKADFAGWHPTIQTVIDAIDHDSCYRYALNDRPPVDNWSEGRATLLGDAAHPTLPYLASGAAMAIEDGAILARSLDAHDDVTEALQVYQRTRLDRTAKVVRESAGNRDLYRIEDVAAMRQAFADKDMTKTRAQWLYSYDPLSVTLAD